ncbi:MAG: type III secretion system chaperone [Candidimonas sp.]|jgi:hypothetical protein
MTARYKAILSELAFEVGLESADDLLSTEELIIGERVIGFSYEPYDVNDPVDGDIVFFAVLGGVPSGRELGFYRLLLEANHLWAGTGGAVLGLQRNTGNVVLAARLPLERLQADHLAGALEAFAETADFWADVLAGKRTDSGSESFLLQA